MPIWLLQLVAGIALNLVVGLAQQAFAPKPAPAQATNTGPTTRGFRGTSTFGGTTPLKIVLGTYGVSGHLDYRNTWGNAGETPNAYLTDVLSLSDLPITAVTATWVNSAPVTVSGSGHVSQGYPVDEYDRGGVDHLWTEVYIGTQSTVSAFLLSAFGADADRPWSSDMVGESVAYVTATALVNDDVWPGFPALMHQVQGKPLFDPRLSTAAGGSGAQVWGTPAGYAFSDNPVVMIYNILRGLYDGDGNHIWGGHASAYQLPYAEWAAAMDACDALVDLDAGGTEKRYRAGIEIGVNERPADVIKELLIGCNGRIAQAQGRYYILIDVPASADGSFTDSDLLATQEATQKLFPNLDNVVNGAAATYLEPQQAWEAKETAPYYRADLEAEDDNRRLLESLDLRTVFSGTQAQRILKAVVEESRRFRRHVVPLPPQFGVYRPLQVLSWTSDEYGYTDKLFLIISKAEDEWGNIVLALHEIDPADFDWDESVDETPLTFAPLTAIVPASQPIAGWAVEPYTDGRRPGVHLEWVGALPDIRAVQVWIRLSGETLPFFDREFPYDRESATQDIYITGDPLLRDTDYEITARFLPPDGSGRPTDWGSWLAVTTPDVGIGIVDLSASAKAVLNQMGQIRTLIEQFKQIGSIIEGMDRDHFTQQQTLSRYIQVQLGDLEASFTEIIEVALGPGGAIATQLESLYAAMGGNTSEVNVKWEAVAAPVGYSARYAVQAAVNDGTFRSATLFLDVPANPAEPTRIGFAAGQTVFFTSGGDALAVVDEDGYLRSANGSVEINLLTGAFSFGI